MRPTRIIVDDWSPGEKALIASSTALGRSLMARLSQEEERASFASFAPPTLPNLTDKAPPQPTPHPSGLNRKQRRKVIKSGRTK